MLPIILDVLVLWKPDIVVVVVVVIVDVGYATADVREGDENLCWTAPASSKDDDDDGRYGDDQDDDDDGDEANVVRVVSKALNCKLSTNAAVAPTTACVCGKATATTVTVFVIVSVHCIELKVKHEKKI